MDALYIPDVLFLKIVNMSIGAGVVMLVVMLLRFIFRKAPRWIFCLLWALAAFRLIFPFSIQSEYSVMSSRQVLPDNFIYAAVPVIDSGVKAVDEAVNEVLAGSLATSPENSVNRTQVLSFIASRVWLLGMSVMLIYAVLSSLILKRRMSTATLLRENVKQSERVIFPFVMGVLRPTIYLPYSIDEADREQVILHEQAHIRRCDHLSKAFAFVLLSVYWFHPLAWVSYVLFCRDMEKACDEKVISSMQEDERRVYASALLNCAAGKRMTVVSPLAFGEMDVKNRIIGVMKYKKPALWLMILALIAAAAAAVCLLTDPPEQHPMYAADDPKALEVTYVPTLQNAASFAAGEGEMVVIYCPAEPKEGEGTIQIGGAVCNEVSAYLMERKWSRLNGNRHLSDLGSIEFVISNSWRVTVYDSRAACVEYGETEQWYRTGWGDYAEALALLHEPPHTMINENSAGDWLKATVVSDARTVYLELGEYIGGDLAEESITKVQASQKGSILFYPDWETDRLIVNEYYHRRSSDGVQTEKKTLYLTRQDLYQNGEGTFVIDFECRESNQDDIEYYVQGRNGNYVFRITFEGVAAIE